MMKAVEGFEANTRTRYRGLQVREARRNLRDPSAERSSSSPNGGKDAVTERPSEKGIDSTPTLHTHSDSPEQRFTGHGASLYEHTHRNLLLFCFSWPSFSTRISSDRAVRIMHSFDRRRQRSTSRKMYDLPVMMWVQLL